MRRALLGSWSVLVVLPLAAGCGSSGAAEPSAAGTGFAEASDASRATCKAAYANSQRAQLERGQTPDAGAADPPACRGLDADTRVDLRLEASRQNMAAAAPKRTWTRTPQRAGARTGPTADEASTAACKAAIRRQIEGDIRVDRSKPAPCRDLDRPTYERLFAETFTESRDAERTRLGFPNK